MEKQQQQQQQQRITQSKQAKQHQRHNNSNNNNNNNNNRRRRRETTNEKIMISPSSPLFKDLATFIYKKYHFRLYKLKRISNKQNNKEEMYVYFGCGNNRTPKDRYCPNKRAAHRSSHTYVSIHHTGYIQQRCLGFKTYNGTNCRKWKGKSYKLPEILVTKLFPNTRANAIISTTPSPLQTTTPTRGTKRKRHNVSDDDKGDRDRLFHPSKRQRACKGVSLSELLTENSEIKLAIGGMACWNHILLIAGDSGVGKTTLIMTLITGYIHGEWIPDKIPVHEDVQGGKVAWVLCEGFAEQMSLFKEWKVENQLDPFLEFLKLNPDGFQYPLSKTNLQHIYTYCSEELRPKVIVVDGFRAALCGDENSSQHTATLLNALNQIAEECQALLIITHHLRKADPTISRGEPSMNWIRGSSALWGCCRSIWIIDQPNPAADKSLRRVTIVKNNVGQQMEWAFTMHDPKDGITFLNQMPSKPPTSALGVAQLWLMEHLKEYGPMTWQEICDLYESQKDSSSFSIDTLKRRARGQLKKQGKISKKWNRQKKSYIWYIVNSVEQQEGDTARYNRIQEKGKEKIVDDDDSDSDDDGDQEMNQDGGSNDTGESMMGNNDDDDDDEDMMYW